MASIKTVRKGAYKVTWEIYDGPCRRQRSRTFATMHAAKEFRDKMAPQERRSIGAVKMTFGDYLDGWISEKAKGIEANTAAGYRRWIGHIGRCTIVALVLEKVTALDLERAYQELLQRGLSPASVRHTHSVVQNALNDAVRHRRIESNPALHAKPPRGQSPKVSVPSVEQVAALLADLREHNAELSELAEVIIGTGLRRSEALGVCWTDVDLDAGQMTIRQAVIEHNGQWSIRPGTKSQAGQRTIGLAPSTVEALRRQKAKVDALKRAISPRFWQENDLVFPATEGGPKAPASVTKAFTRAAKRAGWPPHSSPVHSLRHAAASHALASGGDLAAISKRLGHSSPAVTARIYLSSDAERDRTIAETMAGMSRLKPAAE